MKGKTVFLMAFLLVLTIGMMPNAYALTNVTDCQLLNASDTYVLQNNINASSFNNGACFYVDGAYDIVFDGNGYELERCVGCSGEQAFAKASQPASNTFTLKNITISNEFDAGLNFINDYINIHDTTIYASNYIRPQIKLNVTNTIIDSSNYAMQLQSFGSEEIYIADSEFYCSNIQSENACVWIEGLGTLITLSVQDSIINNQHQAVGEGYGLYYHNATEFGEILNYYFDNNIVNETEHQSIMPFFTGYSTSIYGNTWTNPTSTGHSDTCTNSGVNDFCVEDYLVFSEPFTYDSGSKSLTPYVACVEDWVCDGYGSYSACVNDSQTASCNSAFDNNACGTSYTGDYTEFANDTQACDTCVTNFVCIIYNPLATCDLNDTKTAECVGNADLNNCYATTNLTSDQYSGDYSEYPPQVTACDYCTPNWECNGYGSATCLIDDTNTASCNNTNDTNGCYAQTSLPADQYTGDYTEFANETGVCDYCTPSWSCDGYVNTTCVVVNGTGSLTQSCNSVADANNCFATTTLPADNYVGDYSEYPNEVLACGLEDSQKSAYAMTVLIALIPILIILGLFYTMVNVGDTTRRYIALAMLLILVLIILTLL